MSDVCEDEDFIQIPVEDDNVEWDEGGSEAAAAQSNDGAEKYDETHLEKKEDPSWAHAEDLEEKLVDEGLLLLRPCKGGKKRKQPSAPPHVDLKPLLGVILVQDSKEIERDVEVHRLIRQPRYFDDEASIEPILQGRCFNCGKAGHRANACTFSTREKPCYLCCQFGHEARDCPAQLCFRCGRPGHKSRECPNQAKISSWEMGYGRCLRCASASCACASKADYFRYEGGCTESYLDSDLQRCKCYVCGRYGHISCKKTPTVPARVTCYSCGSSSHVGENCPSESRAHLAAERSGDMRAAQREREAEIERANALASSSRSFGSRQGSFSQQQGGGGHSRLGERSFSYASDREPDRWAMAISPRDYLAGSLDRRDRRGPQESAPPVWSHPPQGNASYNGSPQGYGRGYGQQAYPVFGQQQQSSHPSWAPPANGTNPYGNPPMFIRPW